MSRTIVVRDGDDERTFEGRDLPLVVGGGEGAHVPVPGVADDAPLAFLGIADDHPFVQPGTGGVPVFHNERLIETSRWLSHGDSVRVGDVRIHCELAGERLELRVARVPRGEEPDGDADAVVAFEEIEPVAYPGVGDGRGGARRRIQPLGVLVSAFFLRSP